MKDVFYDTIQKLNILVLVTTDIPKELPRVEALIGMDYKSYSYLLNNVLKFYTPKILYKTLSDKNNPDSKYRGVTYWFIESGVIHIFPLLEESN